MKKILGTLWVLSFALLTACGGGKNEEATHEVKAVDVKVTVLSAVAIKDEFTLPAVAEAWQSVSLSSETTGHVKSILKSDGDKVRKGEPILKINTDQMEANLTSSKIQYEAAKKDFERAEVLIKQQAISQKSFDAVKDAYTLAEVNYKLAVDQYNKSTVVSPINGVVDEIKPSLGEFVPTGQVIATIVQADKLKVYINIPEKDLPNLKKGMDVDVVAGNIGNNAKTYTGHLNYVSVTSDPNSLTYRGRIDIDANDDIRAGNIVRVRLVRKQYNDALVVPMYAIVDKAGQKVVYLESNGKAIETKVESAAFVGSNAVITSGLKVGDRVITTGQQFLNDNTLVHVVE